MCGRLSPLRFFGANIGAILRHCERSEATRCVRLPNTFDWVIASKAKQSTVYECSIRLIVTLALLARNDNKI